MSTTTAQPTTQTRFFPVSIDSLDAHTLTMDLYLRESPKANPVLYRAIGLEFTAADRRRLAESGVEFLYIPVNQHTAFRRALSARLDDQFHDSEVKHTERARLIRSACGQMIQDVLIFPDQPESVEAVADISRQFASWSTEDPVQFSYLLDMSAHDFYTTTHLINVGVGCGLLATELYPGDENLRAILIQGGLLHDVGKRGIPPEILNKEGRLDAAEWEQVRSHPMRGYNELKAHTGMPPTVVEMVRDHHERPDGQGYPNGLLDGQLSAAARICTVVDVFDAICAARPYRGPTPPSDTLRSMEKGRGPQFDAGILDAWKNVVERLLREDSTRAPAASDSPTRVAVGCFGQSPPAMQLDELDIQASLRMSKERRRHRRHECNVPVRARMHWQGKQYPVAIREWTVFKLTDISRGGMQLLTPWPLTINDIVEVEAPHRGSGALMLCGRVVRVRSVGPQEWTAGLKFTNEARTGPPPTSGAANPQADR